jgi:hypothetical protein
MRRTRGPGEERANDKLQHVPHFQASNLIRGVVGEDE